MANALRSFWAVWKRLCGLVCAFLVVIIIVLWGSFGHRTTHAVPNKLVLNPSYPPQSRFSIYPSFITPNDRAFIGIALSGGGSRAANFSIEALHELDELGILEHAEVISSASGGSLTAAYVALKMPDPPTDVFWNDAEAALRQDFKSAFVAQSIKSFPRSIVTTYARGDALADTFDELLFHHAKFSDVPAGDAWMGEHYKPSLFINATSLNDPGIRIGGMFPDPKLPMGSYMGGFDFSNERMRDMLSTLGDIRLSFAVAASGAFPAAVNPLTLVTGDRVAAKDNKGPNEIANLRYIHLADGGLSDNLATDQLRKLYEARMGFQRAVNTEGGEDRFVPRPCLIISIDATAPPISENEYTQSSDGRTAWWSTLVDSDTISGYDAYLLRRRQDALDEMGIDPAGVEYNRLYKSRLTSFGLADLRTRFSRYASSGSLVLTQSVFVHSQNFGKLQAGKAAIDTEKYQCNVWHIALEDVGVLRSKLPPYKTTQAQYDSWLARDQRLSNISATVLTLATDYRLHSSANPSCDPIELQGLLRSAAQEIMLEPRTKDQICDWLDSNKMSSAKCRALPEPTSVPAPSCLSHSKS